MSSPSPASLIHPLNHKPLSPRHGFGGFLQPFPGARGGAGASPESRAVPSRACGDFPLTLRPPHQKNPRAASPSPPHLHFPGSISSASLIMSQRWWLSIFSGRGIQRGKQREREVSISPGVVGSSIAGVAPPGVQPLPWSFLKGKNLRAPGEREFRARPRSARGLLG